MLLGLVLSGLSWGCAQRQGAHALGFQPIWETTPSPEALAGGADSPQKPVVRGLIPDLWERLMGESEIAHDPFLNSSMEQPSPASATQIAETIQDDPSTARITPRPLSGNPFRLVDHEAAVREISAPERPPVISPISRDAVPSAEASPNPEQLDRLKQALNRDAKTERPLQPPHEGGEVLRIRVESLMKAARRDALRGEYPLALQRAITAEQLAARAGLFFGPDEDPPADLVRQLQDRLNLAPPVSEPIIVPSPPVPVMGVPSSLPVIEPARVPQPTRDVADSRVPFTALRGKEGHSLPYTTRAMQQATVVPQSATPVGPPPDDFNSASPLPPVTHHRSLKVDAKRVSANQGAAVTLEGQLNPPKGSVLPRVSRSIETQPELPPGISAVQSALPEPASVPRPAPLPPPTLVETPPPIPPQFWYAAPQSTPPTAPPKNVQWQDEPLTENAADLPWWTFPAIGGLGVALLVLLGLRRRRSA